MPQAVIGLSQREASKRLEKYGPNHIKETGKHGPLQILLRQVRGNFIIYLLAVSSIISFAVGKTETTYALVAVVIVVVVFGFIQEYRAEQAVEALKNMLTQFTTVIRDGREQQVESVNLVPGDVVLIRTGERVPADCAVVEQRSLSVNESILTGESREVKKSVCEHAEKCDETNTVYMGSFVVGGHCMAQVLHTGMNTKFGKIASLISGAEKELTLQRQVNSIGKYMVMVGVLVSLATGALMFARNPSTDWASITDILILVVALSVSSFPEGLPVVLTTTLALGAGRMAKQNAIVNRMSVIETLGETTVICSDKTGTITTGQMTVKKIFCGDDMYEVSGAGFNLNGKVFRTNKDGSRGLEILSGLADDLLTANDKNKMSGHASRGALTYNQEHSGGNHPADQVPVDLKKLLKCAIICNDARIERIQDGGEVTVSGSPTEGALLVLSAKAGVYRENLSFERIEEVPFSSERKMMSVLVDENNQNKDELIIYAKGAPEVILEKCSKLARGEKEVDLAEPNKKIVRALINEMSQGGYRTLALAYKRVNASALQDMPYQEEGLVFAGLLGLEDPPREEAAKAIHTAKMAGIEVKMITGDNIETAISVGKQVGLVGKALEGVELDDLSDDELKEAVRTTTIFARVRPEHKIRVVRALKQLGHIVAMTGDGVNDAPALKESHVGIAMGKNGTDVSRATADITLKDDNFATIVAAIQEGRGVFNNIQKFVAFQLSCNFAELVILFIGVLLAPKFGWQVPIITAIQILFMNLVTDSIPAITLGFNPTSPDIMLAKPRGAKTILSRFVIGTIIFAGALMSMFALFANYFSINLRRQDHLTATTMVTATLICLEVITAFTFRSFRKPVLSRSPFVNKHLVWAAIGSVLATLVIIYTPLSGFFETTPIESKSWLLIIGLCLGITVLFDLAKLVKPQTQHA